MAPPSPHTQVLVDKLEVRVFSSRALAGACAAADAVAHLRALLSSRTGPVRVVFAAAPSQAEMLAGVVAAHMDVDWSRVSCFHMDEYLNLPPSAPQLFSSFLRAHVWDAVRPGVVHVMNSAAADECARYAALLSEAPIDVVLAGVGENGHLAFNDPPPLGGANFQDPALVKGVALDLACRTQQVNDGCFPSLADVPTHALTLTVPALMSGARIFCVVPGPSKRAAVSAMLTCAIEEACPASALRTHNHATLYVDDAAFDSVRLMPLLRPPTLLRGIHYASGMSLALGLCAARGIIASIEHVASLPSQPLPFLAPGLIDLQTNGHAGLDFNTIACAPPGALKAAVSSLLRCGVTSALVTLITHSREVLEANCAAIADACAQDSFIASCVAGIHLEGPFISPLDGYRGAHPVEHCVDPDVALFTRLQLAARGLLRVVTLAPELPGALELIAAATSSGVRVAIGHSAANAAQVRAAIAAGASLSTHLGNACPQLLPRHENTLWAQLSEDALAAGVIADGHHLPPPILASLLRVKEPIGRAFLVSDATSFTGLPPGVYTSHVGGDVVLSDSARLHLASDARVLAGSAITLDRAISHVLASGVLRDTESSSSGGSSSVSPPMRGLLARAWGLASTTPASLLALPQARGLALGAPADVVTFSIQGDDDASIVIVDTYKGGMRCM